MKKLIRILTSVLLSAAVALTPVCAADKGDSGSKKKDDSKSSTTSSSSTVIIPTVCFDTDQILTQKNPSNKDELIMKTFGSSERSGFNMEITRNVARTNGSMSLSQDFAGTLESGQENTGFYLNASSFGLTNFAGTEISFYVYAENPGADRLRFFTDGDVVSYSNDIALTNSPRWEKVVMEVPENVNNYMFGAMVTSTRGYTGTVCYIDDLTVKDSSGKYIANIGDFKATAEGQAAGAFTVVLFVILILAVAAGCAVFVIRMLNRYR